MVKINVRRRIDLTGPTQKPHRIFASPLLTIPGKGAESFGVSRALTTQLKETLEKVFNRCASKDRYFIVVKCNLLPDRVIQTKVIIVNTLPDTTTEKFIAACKTFNTMCFYVDNRKGTVENLWILPRDTVLDSESIPGRPEKGSDRIAKSAEDMPILHG